MTSNPALLASAPPSSSLTPSPDPDPDPASPSKPSHAARIAHLDSLLERYLELLETYTTLRSQLSSQLSSGFFSLAQAQRSATLPPGRRYGEEMYDERMKAGRRVRIGDEGQHGEQDGMDEQTRRPRFSIHQPAPSTHPPPTAHPPPQPDTRIKPDGIPSTKPKSNPKPNPESNLKSPSKPSPTPTAPDDPIRWFGILHPAPLRTAQKSFASAISTSLPGLLNTSLDMAALEGEIAALRAELGLETPGEEVDVAVEEEVQEVQEVQEVVVEAGKKTAATSPRRSLASRTATTAGEPRSRVLKLGS